MCRQLNRCTLSPNSFVPFSRHIIIQVRTYVESGSLILDIPLLYDHPEGTPVVAFSTSVRGAQALDKYAGMEVQHIFYYIALLFFLIVSRR